MFLVLGLKKLSWVPADNLFGIRTFSIKNLKNDEKELLIY